MNVFEGSSSFRGQESRLLVPGHGRRSSSPSLLVVQAFTKGLQRERVHCFSPCQAKSQIPTTWITRSKGIIQKILLLCFIQQKGRGGQWQNLSAIAILALQDEKNPVKHLFLPKLLLLKPIYKYFSVLKLF